MLSIYLTTGKPVIFAKINIRYTIGLYSGTIEVSIQVNQYLNRPTCACPRSNCVKRRAISRGMDHNLTTRWIFKSELAECQSILYINGHV